jgi:hypothetical protein
LDQFNGIKRKIDMRFKSLPDKKLLQLMAQVSQKTAFLDELEKGLLNATSDEDFNNRLDEACKAQWQSFNPIGREELDTLLNQRWQSVSKLKSKAEFEKLLLKGSNEMRDLCIDLEIRANIESPATDQSSRMTIQLAQLKSGFGKAKPDRAENTKFAKAMELRLTCIGPIDGNSHDAYMPRAKIAIDRLK